jgi:predicted ATP-dependent serine protease
MKNPIAYNEVEIIIQEGIKFRDEVLNKFLSKDGGVPLATMIALAGTSGAGKTTLCKKIQKELPSDMVSTFFSLETSKSSLARQTKRVETGSNALVCDDKTFPTWSEFMKYLYTDKPTVAIIDSLQHAAKLLSKENDKFKYENYATIVEDLYNWKEECNTIVIMIVQLNGQGKVEGPEATVFDVDVPLKLVANPKTGERHLEASKNRNGGTVGKIFYDFVGDDRIIQFFEEDEYKVLKQDVSLTMMVNQTIQGFLDAHKNKDGYKLFKKELMSSYNKICKSCSTPMEAVLKTLPLIDELVKKHF